MNIKRYNMTPCGRGNRAFTLMELLVVVFIIALLISILLPTVKVIIDNATAAKTRAWVASLAAGCETYKNQYGFYPGQDPYWSAQLGLGAYTGSQVLCITLLWGNGDANMAGSTMPYPYIEPGPGQGANATYYSDPLVNPNNPTIPQPTYTRRAPNPNLSPTPDLGTVGTTIADKFSNPMPILYYPARLNTHGLDAANVNNCEFRMSDNNNATYFTDSNDPQHTFRTANNFNTYITDPAFATTPATPFRAGGFILISAGLDRKYGLNDPTVNGLGNLPSPTAAFKCDDIRNYTDSRN